LQLSAFFGLYKLVQACTSTEKKSVGNLMCIYYEVTCLLNEQLYAALYEWRTGIHYVMGFTANAYFDVYTGHINTFGHVRMERENVFHTIMADIYTKAR
jgi:hypothetical protein